MTPAITLVNLFQSSRDEPVMPLGCLWLRASLEARGMGAEIRDLQFLPRPAFWDPDALAAALGDTHPVVGISCMADTLPLAVALGKRLEEADPQRILVYGGWGPTTVARQLVAAFPWIDFIVRGEGDEALPELLDALASGDPTQVRGVDGRWDGEVFHTPDRPLILDVAGLPEPRHDDLELSDYAYYTSVTARGCPFQCQFCEIPTVESRRVRSRTPDAVVAELSRAHFEHGVDFVGFQDDIFLLSKKRVEAILDGLEAAGVDIGWAGFARACQVDAAWLADLRGRGLRHVSFGIEAGSDALLGQIAKRLGVREALDGIATALREVDVRCFFLWGFPTETLEDFFGTAQAIFHAELLGAVVEVGQVVPLPGSPLYLKWGGPLEYSDDYPFCRLMRPPTDPELRAMVLAHPTIFSSFYSFPTPDREAKWAMANQLCCRA